MSFEKIFEFLNKGGLLAGAVITCYYAFIKIDRLEIKTDKLEAVLIDCYQERVDYLQMNKVSENQKDPNDTMFFKPLAILPSQIKIEDENS